MIVTGTASADTELFRTVTATCTGGKVVVGGGYRATNVSSQRDIVVTDSYASSTTVWTAVGMAYDTAGDKSFSLTAYAICANSS